MHHDRKRKICIVTGTRAEYGLLSWLMKEIQSDEGLILQLVVTGMHLSPEFGMTYRDIEEDGFLIDAKVEMLMSSDTYAGVVKSMGLGLIGFADVFESLKPDLLVLLGDRYEVLAAAQTALIEKIPIAHLCGGETTEGSIDEAIRHSITKMAQLHFVAAAPYQKRVLQLGENPNRVYCFGHPGLDYINRLEYLSREELGRCFGFDLSDTFFLVTYHPTTLSDNSPEEEINELVAALNYFPNVKVAITLPNSDSGGRKIAEILEAFARRNANRVYLTHSLGQKKYLSAMKYCNAIIGNSSSGIFEAPALKKATVNIGSRQQGRIKARSIIDCDAEKEDIINAIFKALSKEFQESLSSVQSLYGIGNASLEIKEILKSVDLEGILIKKFFDVGLKQDELTKQ